MTAKRYTSPDEKTPHAFTSEPDVGHTGCNFCDRYVPCVQVMFWAICRECAARVGPLLDGWERTEAIEAEEEAQAARAREKQEASIASEPLGPEPAPQIPVPRSLFCLKCERFKTNCECPKEVLQ